MNLGVLANVPNPGMYVSRPIRVAPKGNIFKIPLTHTTQDGRVNNVEVWTTRQAMQKHLSATGLGNPNEMPKSFQIRKFARQVYEKQLRTKNGPLQHNGILVSSDDVKIGNPKLWPSTISHPEFKMSEETTD